MLGAEHPKTLSSRGNLALKLELLVPDPWFQFSTDLNTILQIKLIESEGAVDIICSIIYKEDKLSHV